MTQEEAHKRFLTEVERWFADHGDQTHRISYELIESSIVIDLGGYKGDWATAIFNKYECTVHVFEPVKSFFNAIKERFAGNDKLLVYNYGLAPKNGTLNINVSGDASSTFTGIGNPEKINLVEAGEFLCRFQNVDLMKVNIEGGEYDLMDYLIDKHYVDKINNIQVQFHTFIQDCATRRESIRNKLSRTHRVTYNYDFVWENWERI